jgi:hypothetical protein
MSGEPDFTRAQFVQALKALGMRQGQFAALCGYPAATVYNWGVNMRFPRWARVLLASMLTSADLMAKLTATQAELQAARKALEAVQAGKGSKRKR